MTDLMVGPTPGREPSREAILGADDTVIEFVPTPEWPCDVYVKSISGGARDRFDKSLMSKDGKNISAADSAIT